MGKFIRFWGAVLGVVIVVELALGYFLVPVANIAVVGIAIFASVVILLLFVIVVMLMRDRAQERGYTERREQRTHRTHRETLQVLAVLSYRQQAIIDRLLAEGAEVKRLGRGGYALVRPDGTYAPLSKEEASYALQPPIE
jgi:uncharacterized membrane protein